MTRWQLLIAYNKNITKLGSEDLLYITTDNISDHTLSFVTEKKIYYCKGSLADYEKKGVGWLFRCHRSSLVNLQKITAIDRRNKKILFEGNRSCQCSRRKLHQLINSWQTFP